jgi:hypothetical protein
MTFTEVCMFAAGTCFGALVVWVGFGVHAWRMWR